MTRRERLMTQKTKMSAALLKMVRMGPPRAVPERFFHHSVKVRLRPCVRPKCCPSVHVLACRSRIRVKTLFEKKKKKVHRWPVPLGYLVILATEPFTQFVPISSGAIQPHVSFGGRPKEATQTNTKVYFFKATWAISLKP